jgi:hypothetical protein
MHINCLSSDVTLSSQNPRDAVWSEEERVFLTWMLQVQLIRI